MHKNKDTLLQPNDAGHRAFSRSRANRKVSLEIEEVE